MVFFFHGECGGCSCPLRKEKKSGDVFWVVYEYRDPILRAKVSMSDLFHESAIKSLGRLPCEGGLHAFGEEGRSTRTLDGRVRTLSANTLPTLCIGYVSRRVQAYPGKQGMHAPTNTVPTLCIGYVSRSIGIPL